MEKDEPVRGPGGVLRRLTHAFASTEDPEEARSATLYWTVAAVGSDAGVRLYLADGQGRLRLAATHGESNPGRRATARRRAAVEGRRAEVHPLPAQPGRAAGVLPLVSRGESIGLLEVTAPTERLTRSWPTLEAVAAQTAIVFRNIGVGSTSRRLVKALSDVSVLTGRLMRARRPEAAVQMVTRFCWEALRVPVAAWVRRTEDARAELVTMVGLGRGKRAQLNASFGCISEGDIPSGDDPLERRLAVALGVDAVSVVTGPGVIICAGAGSPQARELLIALGSVLEQALDYLRRSARVDAGMRRLDVGLGWVAHEFVGPLSGARAAMEHAMDDPTAPPIARLLEGSHRELGRLITELELMLRWAVEGGELRRRSANLTELVRETARSVDRQFSEDDRVGVSGPELIPVRVSAAHLRSAIGNVIRNALTYSPSGSPVDVSVDLLDGAATVTVSDRGPGIPRSQSETIFDAFVRGPGNSARGAGLGLFIARRVVEAHGGTISVLPSAVGSTFLIRIPAGRGEGHAEQAS
jgi:hypothetical protein